MSNSLHYKYIIKASHPFIKRCNLAINILEVEGHNRTYVLEDGI